MRAKTRSNSKRGKFRRWPWELILPPLSSGSSSDRATPGLPEWTRRLPMKPNFEKHALAAVLKNVPEFNPSKVKESRWLIDCFLAEGSIQLIYGTYGTFKSTLLLKAAWAVSRGEDFLGMKVRKRVVLYFDYENPPSVIKGRCHDLGVRLPSPMFRIWDRFHGEEPLAPGNED